MPKEPMGRGLIRPLRGSSRLEAEGLKPEKEEIENRKEERAKGKDRCQVSGIRFQGSSFRIKIKA